MQVTNKVKKTIKYRELVIKLYHVDREKAKFETVANIEAFDKAGKLIWTAEDPSKSTHYYDMQIDEENNLLEADSGAGTKYEIDLSNGRILKSFLIK